MTILFNLYSTSYCHLCEQAEELIDSLKKEYDISFLIIDIAHDMNLEATYERKIPVLKRLDNNQEIGWPFFREDIKRLIVCQSVSN